MQQERRVRWEQTVCNGDQNAVFLKTQAAQWLGGSVTLVLCIPRVTVPAAKAVDPSNPHL